MGRPKDLFQAVQHDPFARLLPRVIGGETAVMGGMPILRGNDQFELGLQCVDDGNNFVCFGDGQWASGNEVGLDMDDEQSVHGWKSCYGKRMNSGGTWSTSQTLLSER